MLPSIRTRKFFVTTNGDEIPLENVYGVGWDIEGPYVSYSDGDSLRYRDKLDHNNVELFNHLLGIIKSREYRKSTKNT